MSRSSSIPRLEGLPARDIVVIRLPVGRRARGLRARLADGRMAEASVVLVTLALVVSLLVFVQHAVEPPTFTAAPPPSPFMLPVGP